MSLDVQKFTEHLRENADTTGYGKGQCALSVRLALQEGNVSPPTWPRQAKDWGPSLLRAGFREIKVDDPETFRPIAGDIAVIQATSRRLSGHIQGFDGRNWISDFVQTRGFWPGPEYRSEKPSYVVYRPY